MTLEGVRIRLRPLSQSCTGDSDAFEDERLAALQSADLADAAKARQDTKNKSGL